MVWLSHSTMPPWPPMILATSARPRPEPFVLVEMKDRRDAAAGRGGTPGPLSCTQNSSGSEIFSRVPATESRMPVDRRSSAGSRRRLCRQWLRRRSSRGSGTPAPAGRGWHRPAAGGVVVFGDADLARKPARASAFTWSSTEWMLTGWRSTGRSSENTSIRSTSETMRSVSSQISRVSARSSSDTAVSSSCAAPRMPESGFLISCASMEARPVTERAAARCVSCRSILSAIERSWNTMTTEPARTEPAPHRGRPACRRRAAVTRDRRGIRLTAARRSRTWSISVRAGCRRE